MIFGKRPEMGETTRDRVKLVNEMQVIVTITPGFMYQKCTYGS
jgi:hypothetical protein